VPEGAVIPFTDSIDFKQLHDEPSRQVRVFPQARSGTSAFVLYEDDGISHACAQGDYAEVTLELASTPRTITVKARKTGRYRLPYDSIRVVLPEGESRRLVLRGTDIKLFA